MRLESLIIKNKMALKGDPVIHCLFLKGQNGGLPYPLPVILLSE